MNFHTKIGICLFNFLALDASFCFVFTKACKSSISPSSTINISSINMIKVIGPIIEPWAVPL